MGIYLSVILKLSLDWTNPMFSQLYLILDLLLKELLYILYSRSLRIYVAISFKILPCSSDSPSYFQWKSKSKYEKRTEKKTKRYFHKSYSKTDCRFLSISNQFKIDWNDPIAYRSILTEILKEVLLGKKFPKWFADIEKSLHPWDKAHLVMVYDLFNVLLDSDC